MERHELATDKSINNQQGNGRERLAISIKEAAEMLSVSPSFLRLEIARGNIRPVRFGRRVLISGAEIQRYIAANTEDAS